MERKIFQGQSIKADSDQGIVESIVAVFGNVDDGNDVIHPGAFRKTINERGGKVKVLDHHRTDSTMAVIGKPLAMKELDRAELPQEMLQRYPEATGGLWTRTQFLMNTPEGKGVFERIKAGALDEWSIGYDALDTDYSKVVKDGKEIAVRNLRTMKLYEYSPVVFAMNPAASTLSAKDKPDEAKPWGVVEEDGKYCVYKLDADGKPTGERLGEHETEEEAQAQLRALYANEEDEDKAAMRTEADGEHPAGHYLVTEDPEKPSTWHLRVRGPDGKPDHRLMGAAWAALHGGYRGNVYEGPGKAEAIAQLRRMYASEEMEPPKEAEKAGRRMRRDKADLLNKLTDILGELRKWAEYDDEEEPEEDEENPAPKEAADNQEHEQKQAGPVIEPPTSTLLKLIEIEQARIDLALED